MVSCKAYQQPERLKNVIKEVLDSEKSIILMIDEIHTLVGAGGTGDGGGGGAIDAANIMKPALSRGELQVIGATTNEEYRKYVEKDKACELAGCGFQVWELFACEQVGALS
ncbi:clpB [Symbiodinium sp. CCMP2592]|nr:clpB [Symbiodinium sp. CCMP2592]